MVLTAQRRCSLFHSQGPSWLPKPDTASVVPTHVSHAHWRSHPSPFPSAPEWPCKARVAGVQSQGPMGAHSSFWGSLGGVGEVGKERTQQVNQIMDMNQEWDLCDKEACCRQPCQAGHPHQASYEKFLRMLWGCPGCGAGTAEDKLLLTIGYSTKIIKEKL